MKDQVLRGDFYQSVMAFEITICRERLAWCGGSEYYLFDVRNDILEILRHPTKIISSLSAHDIASQCTPQERTTPRMELSRDIETSANPFRRQE